VVWQLVFILAANFLSILPEKSAAGPAAVTNCWAELTGQWQGWSLYAPFVPHQAVFLEVELRWDNNLTRPAPPAGSVRLRPANEPDDPYHYRRPVGTFRLPQYPANLSLVLWAWDGADYARDPEKWRQEIAKAVRNKWRPTLAYLRWALSQYERDHPGRAPPRQVILVGRLYSIPPPGEAPWHWDGPHEVPLARWQPGSAVPEDRLPLESYDPVKRRFEPLPTGE
jgi:hypothetical protein